MKKMFNEGNQIHNFMSSSGYRSGSTSQKVMVPTVPVPVPVPQHWYKVLTKINSVTFGQAGGVFRQLFLQCR